MPGLKPCPHCGILVEDWHREWYTIADQILLFQHRAAADCPNPDCRGSVDLYPTTHTVPAADPGLPVLRRSRQNARTWAGSDELLDDYLNNVSAGRQYRGYPFNL